MRAGAQQRLTGGERRGFAGGIFVIQDGQIGEIGGGQRGNYERIIRYFLKKLDTLPAARLGSHLRRPRMTARVAATSLESQEWRL